MIELLFASLGSGAAGGFLMRVADVMLNRRRVRAEAKQAEADADITGANAIQHWQQIVERQDKRQDMLEKRLEECQDGRYEMMAENFSLKQEVLSLRQEVNDLRTKVQVVEKIVTTEKLGTMPK